MKHNNKIAPNIKRDKVLLAAYTTSAALDKKVNSGKKAKMIYFRKKPVHGLHLQSVLHRYEPIAKTSKRKQ